MSTSVASSSMASQLDESGATMAALTSTPKASSMMQRNSTQPANMGASPRQAVLQRQLSAQSAPHAAAAAATSSTSPTTSITAYIKYLLGMNAKPTKRTLSEEAECGTPESIVEWVRQGSNANEVDAYGYTPLVNACLRGCIKTVKILISQGADVNMQVMHGYTPLHAAAQHGSSEIIEALVDAGADMEVKNDDGDTALMLAVRSEHAACVDALCKRGCNVHTQGFDHIEPIDYAKNKKNAFLSDVLLKHDPARQSPTAAASTSPPPRLSSTFSHVERTNSILEADETDEAELVHQAPHPHAAEEVFGPN